MKNNKKILVMSFLLMAIVLLSVGTIAYFRRSVNGNITGNTGILVFNVNGLTGETSETLEYSLNRSSEEPYVYPDDSGYFDLEITAEGSSTDVYVTLDIIRDHLPDNLKFYTDEEHKVEINKKYFFFEKTKEMSDTLRIYWFWDGTIDDENDSLFINEELSARISLSATPMEYGMMENGAKHIYPKVALGLEPPTGFWQMSLLSMIKETTFTNDFSFMPEECTEENLCFDISYEKGQRYPVYAVLVETEETGRGFDNNMGGIIEGNLYELYIICSKTVFAPSDSSMLFFMQVNLKNINFNNWFNTSLVSNMSNMFNGCSSLSTLNLESFNTSNVHYINGLVSTASNLADINLEAFDTSNVIDMSIMFSGCPKLTNLNLNSFDTSNVVNMAQMFAECTGLTKLNLKNFDTSNVTDMNGMFRNVENLLSINLESFDTSSVTNMSYMFKGCKNLTYLNIKHFDTTNVTETSDMFYGCEKLSTEITIRGNLTTVSYMVSYAARYLHSKIVLNYVNETSGIVDGILSYSPIETFNSVKGTLLSSPSKYTIALDNDTITYNAKNTNLFEGTFVELIPTESNKYISSFKLNGETVMGNNFILTTDTVITDVVMYDIVIESEINATVDYYSSNNINQTYIINFEELHYLELFVNGVKYGIDVSLPGGYGFKIPKGTTGNLDIKVQYSSN